jgi:hypothetical protein
MHLPFATVLSSLPSMDAKYVHLLLQILRIQNDNGKEYKTLFQTFVWRQIIRHDENWSTRIRVKVVNDTFTGTTTRVACCGSMIGGAKSLLCSAGSSKVDTRIFHVVRAVGA